MSKKLTTDGKASLEQRLANYKEMQKGNAEARGCTEQFMKAKTLTQARKILWGERKKRCTAYR